MSEGRPNALFRLGDNCAIALVAMLFVGAYFSGAYAGDGAWRSGAWMACAVMGCWAVAGWAMGRWNDVRLAPGKWLLLAFAAVCGWVGIQIVKLPAEWVLGVSPWARESQVAVAATGLEFPDSLSIAIAPETAARSLDQLIACAFFLAGVLLLAARRTGAIWLVAILAVFTLVEGIIGLVRFLVFNAPRANGAVYNANHHAAAVAAGLPLYFAALREWRRHNRLLASDPLGGTNPILFLHGLGLAAILGWVVSFSRASLLFAVPVWAVYLVIEWRTRAGFRSTASPARWLVGGALGVAALALAFYFGGGMLERLFRGDSLSGNSRLLIWRATWHGFADSNFLGVGLGGTEFLINRYANFPLMSIPIWAHNDYLQWTAELGLPGLALVLVPALLFVRSAWGVLSARWGKTLVEERAIPRAAIAGLAILLLHASADFHLRIPLVSFMTLTLLALALQTGSYRIHALSR